MTKINSDASPEITDSPLPRSVHDDLPLNHTMERLKLDPDHPDQNRTTILFSEGISSVQGGVFNYANTYVGAGIIGIPLARE